MLISIIIPAYNADRYIRNCLNSIVRQSYTNFEVIIVNDGSKDNTLKICRTFAENDNRFLITNKKNEGVSEARNIGIVKAKGDWITFIDSDDSLEVDYLKELINRIDDTVDFVFQGVKRLTDENIIISQTDIINETVNSNSFNKLFNTHQLSLRGNPVSKLFKSKIIKDNNLKFNSNITYNEDMIFILEYVLFCEGYIVFSDTINYNYYIHSGSITNTLLPPEEYWKPFTYFKSLIKNGFKIDYRDPTFSVLYSNFKILLHMFMNAVFLQYPKNEERYLKLLDHEDWQIYKQVSKTSSIGRKVFDFFMLNKSFTIARIIAKISIGKKFGNNEQQKSTYIHL